VWQTLSLPCFREWWRPMRHWQLQKDPQRITEVEFIELWEDRAIQAFRALSRLEQDPDLRGDLPCPELIAVKGGRQAAEL